MKSRCPICEKGLMQKKQVEVEKYGLKIGRFEAEICNSCGEEIFESKEALRIEAKMKALGIWSPEHATLYKIGGNFAIAIRKKIAQMLGITKDSKISLVPQERARRIIVEIS